MAALVGRKVTLTWGGVVIDGCREKAVALNGEPVDITSDDDLGWRTLLEDDPAENQINLSVSGVTKSQALKASWFTNARMGEAIFTYPDGTTITGQFYLGSFTETGPYNDALTFEAELQSSGEIIYSAGA
jgi:predicted secreted protein